MNITIRCICVTVSAGDRLYVVISALLMALWVSSAGRFQAAEGAEEMISSWLRTTIILALLATWIGYIVVQLIRDKDIDSLVWGIPGGFFLLLGGPGLKEQHAKDHVKDKTDA